MGLQYLLLILPSILLYFIQYIISFNNIATINIDIKHTTVITIVIINAIYTIITVIAINTITTVIFINTIITIITIYIITINTFITIILLYYQDYYLPITYYLL